MNNLMSQVLASSRAYFAWFDVRDAQREQHSGDTEFARISWQTPQNLGQAQNLGSDTWPEAVPELRSPLSD